ncbi:hypothetical protein FOPG_16777 [Fusarium oxysporum f. sp. conglutinans race 2 54008]|uniref:Uncharacterized protein n=1 Tax=Fusarium oxysporum f. sp. conglutinans race 2 54008 TaxID=1089457 RepID=X0GUK3_FUSOX|nr:hypothetical protein FOPG_16777 [Fusarium oxysporum f. sp. conglutinans race 2 54008]
MPTNMNNEPIAVIGSSCRFAGGVTSPSRLWELLKEPPDVLGEIPESRFHADGFYHPNGAYHGHTNVRSSYMLDAHPGAFDAKFFRTKPVEAKAIDPQQRVLLEVVYEGLESAGLPIEQLRGSKTAVYVGMMSNDYENMLVQDVNALPTYHGTVRALRAGDASVAVACGSNLILGPNFFIFESKLNMLSPDSRSRMWDEGANGYARGEGVAVIILKPLKAAIRDGDDIECVIRETDLNQDGATNGITMPSVHAQVDLIRETYAKAGLDPVRDRPQYFEAHGTGTQAGDPIEAEAIRTALIHNNKNDELLISNQYPDPLYVGSIKTVLGHTESAAGVAGLLKASLALRHAVIPPNLLFTRLSPKVAPFYDGLRIPTTARAWPDVPEGQPRRASVNSFGFGGANAHAILESFESQQNLDENREGTCDDVFGPYVFSAETEGSLLATLEAYSSFLGSQREASIVPHDLAWTLRARRSMLTFRTALPAGSISNLKANIDTKLQAFRQTRTSLGIRPSARQPRILGIFTGQGAQYVRMGAELLEKSPLVQQILRDLEDSLSGLPEADRPTWLLTEELLADMASSRIYEAAISQPLCTAVQIVIVDLLKYAGVTFHGVIGHSSGEIAAAYAAGYISAHDAIRIAYYRGLWAKLSRSPNGEQTKGAMLAVGTSMDDAQELLRECELHGRVRIAASNSSSSITLSGDEDAIEELETLYDEEKKFRRRLRVDIAYHSDHMLPCSGPYVQSLRDCNIQVQDPRLVSCVWYSTVYEDADMNRSDIQSTLTDTYWSDNMTSQVMFFQGLERALAEDDFDLVLEIGPHPALKGPAMQTIKEKLQEHPPYYGTLERKKNAVEALSTTLGSLWCHHDSPHAINLSSYEESVRRKELDNGRKYNVVKNLPSYPWDHSRVYWHESRQTRNIRHRKDSVHPLLGHVCPDSVPHQMSWRHLLRAREIHWLTDHQLQGKPVFPAAGYISSMLEASSRLLSSSDGPVQSSSSIRLIEASDFVVHRAMVFNEAGDDGDEAGIETIVSMTNIVREREHNEEVIRASFSYTAAVDKEADDMALMASGKVVVYLGDASDNLLPPKDRPPPNLISIGQDYFFDSLAKVGYGYSGPFKAATGLKRCLGKAETTIDQASLASVQDEGLLAHPGILDSALQTLLLAFSHPGDGQLWSVFVPVRFDNIRVNPLLCESVWNRYSRVEPHSASTTTVSATVGGTDGVGFTGDVDIFFKDDTAIQIQGIGVSPFASASATDDERMFARMRWAKMNLEEDDIVEAKDHVTQEQRDLCLAAERIAVYYMRKFDTEVPEDHPARSDPTFGHYLQLCRHVTGLVDKGMHKYALKEWAIDALEDIMTDCARFDGEIDIKILRTIGDLMPRVFEGETTILENLFPTGLMTDYYANSLGQQQSMKWIGRAVAQITHRYPRMNILEVGAGTGGATKSVLRHIGPDGFRSYTFTDVSTAFFEQAQTDFGSKSFGKRITYCSLDVSSDPVAQGFNLGSYDLIIASFVIHATPSLEKTIHGLRSLLRPGGFIVVGEITNLDLARVNFVFGTLPGMWAGVAEGRILSPYVRAERWDAALRNAGFSGIDAITSDELADTYAASVFVSQAVDDQIKLLREPTSLSSTPPPMTNVILVGGATHHTYRLVDELNNILNKYCSGRVSSFMSLSDVPHELLTSGYPVLGLTDLDKPLFDNVKPAEFDGLKRLVSSEKTLLWITRRRRAGNAFSNLTVGFLRNAKCEVRGLRVQSVDFEGDGEIDARTVADLFLSLQHAVSERAAIDDKNKLWSIEPEIIVDSRGRRLIPRFESISDADDRYNSTRRQVTKDVSPTEAPVAIYMNNQDQVILVEVPRSILTPREDATTSIVKLQASHVLPWPIDTPLGPRFLSIGVEKQSERKHLALSRELVSALSVTKTTAVAVPSGIIEGLPDRLLVLVAANLWSATILGHVLPGQNIVVHNSSPTLASVLKLRAAEQRVSVTLTSDDRNIAMSRSWMHIPLYMPKRELKQLLTAAKASFCVVFSGSAREGQHPLLSCLPRHCRLQIINSAISSSAEPPSGFLPSSEENSAGNETLGRMLTEAWRCARSDVMKLSKDEADGQPTLLTPDILASGGRQPLSHDPLSVMHWCDIAVPARVLRLDAIPLFEGYKTYWLVGLTSGLGLSICDWMIAHGARYVVLSSRNPKIEASWLEKYCRRDVVVRVLPCDITSQKAVDEAHAVITTDSELPPLGGLMNGAMVLRDIPIRDMSLDDLTSVLRPKVNGSLHLDHVLGDTKLDFFILFSSMVNVLGNVGQANYCAANAFMSGLAAQRRRRGLAACVVNIGAVSGAGYITREMGEDGADRLLLLAGLKRVSEVDVHQLLAEAIVGGTERLDIDYEPEISLALHGSDELKPMWFEDPKFARFVPGMNNEEEGMGVANEEGLALKGGAISIKDRLALSWSLDNVKAVVKDTFLSRLRAILQMDDTAADGLMRMRSNQLGIDSLVAVDLRSWFLKHFRVSVPVLEILGGTTVSDLVDQVTQKIPPELVPKLALAASTAPTSVVTQPSSTLITPKKRSDTPTASVSPTATDTETSSWLGSSDHQAKGNVSLMPVTSLALERSVELSFTQSMFWIVHMLVQDKTTLNHTVLFRLTEGCVRTDDLRAAVRAMGQRHEALRTCFYENNGHFQQGVLQQGTLELEQKTITSENEAIQEFKRLKEHTYDLASGHVMRFVLLTTSDPTRSYIVTGAHHIVIDGFCLQVFLRDIQATYDGPKTPLRSHTASVKQYGEFATSQRAALSLGVWNADLAYWRQEFASIPEPLPLRRARISVRKPLTNYEVHRCDFTVDASLANRIRALVRVNGATAFHFYLATFRVLLYRMLLPGVDDGDTVSSLDDTDICIGIADANRKDDDEWSSVGPYMNLLPLRFPPQQAPKTTTSSATTFKQVLETARDKTLAALRHSAPAFEAILDDLRVERAIDQAPLFQAFVDYRQGWHQKQTFLGCAAEMTAFEPGRTPYDFGLDIIDNSSSGRETVVSVMLQSALYDREDADVFARCYEDILREFSYDPDKHVDCRNWSFREDDINRALELGRGHVFRTEWSDTLIHRVESVVRDYGDKTAIRIAGKSQKELSLTYQQLWKRVTVISEELLLHHVSPGQHVAVYQEATADFVCSMLAVMMVGATYVPLDVGSHLARLGMILSDCQPTAFLVDAKTRDNAHEVVSGLQSVQVATIDVSKTSTRTEKKGVIDLQVRASSIEPAMLLYTSGTTGTPKGVVLKHSSFAHEVELNAKTYSLGSNTVVLQQSACGFDMAVQQVFVALAHGGTLCIVPQNLRGDSVAVVDAIIDCGVTLTCATPTEYSSWLRYGNKDQLRQCAWRVAVSGGESATELLLQQFRKLDKEGLGLFNCYGPTETTCCSTKMELDYKREGAYDAYKMIPVGPASANESIYIVDEQMRLLPPGLSGEIVIGGAGVAAGYLNDEAKTRGAFLADVFASEDYVKRGWDTMYRTKDRGRLLPNGWVSIEGRIGHDTLIKLRGMRIDLRDIENTILISAPGGAISEAVASVRSDGDSAFIVAHVSFTSDNTVLSTGEDEGHTYLSRLLTHLPLSRHMRPSVLLPVNEWPTTSSGKLDRRAISQLPITLPLYKRESDGEGSDQPRFTNAENKLQAVWERVLSGNGRHLMGSIRHDPFKNFFHVGGTSMLLLELRAQIGREFGISVRLAQLFENSTLAAMAQLVEQADDTQAASGRKETKTGIAWEEEARLPTELENEIRRVTAATSAGQHHPKVILLTGATGNLGRHILRLLLDNTLVDKVICVALRDIDKRISAGILPAPESPPRVVYCPGDLRQPRLGLSKQDFASLSRQIDAVVHIGADVSHAKTYETLREANVGSVKELIRLCLPRRASMHFVSSGEVAMLGNDNRDGHWQYNQQQNRSFFSEQSATANGVVPCEQDAVREGYAASKWVAEHVLENVCAIGRGLRVWVHRPSSIMPTTGAPVADVVGGTSHKGDNQELAAYYSSPDAPLLQSFLYYSHKLGMVPNTTGFVDGSLDLVKLEHVAENIVKSVLFEDGNDTNVEDQSGGRIVYRNHVGDLEIQMDKIAEYFKETSKGEKGAMGEASFKTISLAEWTAKARAAGLHPLLADFFENASRDKRIFSFPKFVKGSG